MEQRAGFKGVKTIKYPSEDTILRFGTKSRTGDIVLEEATGLFKFIPELEIRDLELKVDRAGDTMTGPLILEMATGNSLIIRNTTEVQGGIYAESVFRTEVDDVAEIPSLVIGTQLSDGTAYSNLEIGNSLTFNGHTVWHAGDVPYAPDMALRSYPNTFRAVNTFEREVVMSQVSFEDNGPVLTILGSNGVTTGGVIKAPGIRFKDGTSSNSLNVIPGNEVDEGIMFMDSPSNFYIRADKLLSGTNINIVKNSNTGSVIINAGDVDLDSRVAVTGDVMTGTLTLSNDTLTSNTVLEILENHNQKGKIEFQSGSGTVLSEIVENGSTLTLKTYGYSGDLYGGEYGIVINSDEGATDLNGNKFWTAENDGHGSGLDADTTDGVHLVNSGSATQVLMDDGNYHPLPGGGDMLKATYDTNGNGIVDEAETVNGHTVLTDVPAGAFVIGDGGLTEKNLTYDLWDTLNSVDYGANKNVQIDWESSVAYHSILNKPIIPTFDDPDTNNIDADKVDGYHIEVVSALPGTTDDNTIYFVL